MAKTFDERVAELRAEGYPDEVAGDLARKEYEELGKYGEPATEPRTTLTEGLKKMLKDVLNKVTPLESMNPGAAAVPPQPPTPRYLGPGYGAAPASEQVPGMEGDWTVPPPTDPNFMGPTPGPPGPVRFGPGNTNPDVQGTRMDPRKLAMFRDLLMGGRV